MFPVGGVEIVDGECQMKFIIPEVVRCRAVAHPGQFQFVCAVSVAEIDDDEAPVGGSNPAGFSEAESIPIKSQALLEIENVYIIVGERVVHG